MRHSCIYCEIYLRCIIAFFQHLFWSSLFTNITHSKINDINISKESQEKRILSRKERLNIKKIKHKISNLWKVSKRYLIVCVRCNGTVLDLSSISHTIENVCLSLISLNVFSCFKMSVAIKKETEWKEGNKKILTWHFSKNLHKIWILNCQHHFLCYVCVCESVSFSWTWLQIMTVIRV